MKNFKYEGLGTYKRSKAGRFDSFKTFVRRVVRWTIKWSVISAAVLTLAAVIGSTYFSSSTVTYAEKKVEVVVPGPILDRISDCESGNGMAGSASQSSKDGQTVIHINNNGTYDIGKYQINSIHRAQATKLGFDLFTEAGNKAFAEWMWNNKGTGDWDSSAHCWRK